MEESLRRRARQIHHQVMVLANPDVHQPEALARCIHSKPFVSLSSKAFGVPGFNYVGLTGCGRGRLLSRSQRTEDFLRALGTAGRERSAAGPAATMGLQPHIADFNPAAFFC
jgi:hypothetical protein